MPRTPCLAALLLALALPPAWADGLSLDLGSNGEGSPYARLGVQRPFESSWLQSRHGRLTGYWEAAFSYWNAQESRDNYTLSLAPVFVYEFHGSGIRPFVEAGIGVSAFRHTQLDDHRLGTALQFEDRLGVGLRLGNGQSLGLRAMHYSNAGARQPNDGMESYSLFYQWQY